MFGFRNLSKDRTEFKSDEHAKNLSHERVSAYLGLGQWTKVGLLEHLAIAFYEVAVGLWDSNLLPRDYVTLPKNSVPK